MPLDSIPPHILRDAGKLAGERISNEIARVNETFGPHPDILLLAGRTAMFSGLVAATGAAAIATEHISARTTLLQLAQDLAKDCERIDAEVQKTFDIVTPELKKEAL